MHESLTHINLDIYVSFYDVCNITMVISKPVIQHDPCPVVYMIVRFQVITAASMKFRIVFWDVLPCKIIVD
jgi:hypothetical protein